MTSDVGLLLLRELDERLGLSALIEQHITDPRTERDLQFALPDLVRYRSFEYQAASWDWPRHVIAKVEHHPGELVSPSRLRRHYAHGDEPAVVRFYNQRRPVARWIKEGKAATHWTRLSCHRFRANEVRLLLGVNRLQPWQSAAPAGSARLHPDLVPHEPPTAALQDRRALDPACAVLHPATRRKLLDREPLSADCPAHWAARVAPDLIASPAE